MLLWRGQATGQLNGGGPFSPRVRLLGELGPAPTRERAVRRLEAFVAAEAARRLRPLRALKSAVSEGRIKGLARGLAYRLVEAGGVIDRAPVEADVRALSQVERRILRGFGVRFGAFSLFMPPLLSADALDFTAAFAALWSPDWRPRAGAVAALPEPAPAPTALAALGLRAVGGLAAPVEALEKLDELLRAAPRRSGAAALDDAAIASLGWSRPETELILRGLGYLRAGRPAADEVPAWRRRSSPQTPQPAKAPPTASPFAALAALTPPAKRRPRRKRPRRAAAS
jgi:ATP-dependent RNA helicase SUPV3L1/SUV3